MDPLSESLSSSAGIRIRDLFPHRVPIQSLIEFRLGFGRDLALLRDLEDGERFMKVDGDSMGSGADDVVGWGSIALDELVVTSSSSSGGVSADEDSIASFDIGASSSRASRRESMRDCDWDERYVTGKEAATHRRALLALHLVAFLVVIGKQGLQDALGDVLF